MCLPINIKDVVIDWTCGTKLEHTSVYMVLVGCPEGDTCVYCRIILKWILKRMDCYGLGLYASEKGHVAGCFEHGKEPSGFINCEGFFD